MKCNDNVSLLKDLLKDPTVPITVESYRSTSAALNNTPNESQKQLNQTRQHSGIIPNLYLLPLRTTVKMAALSFQYSTLWKFRVRCWEHLVSGGNSAASPRHR